MFILKIKLKTINLHIYNKLTRKKYVPIVFNYLHQL